MDDFYVHFRQWIGDGFDEWYSDAIEIMREQETTYDLADDAF